MRSSPIGAERRCRHTAVKRVWTAKAAFSKAHLKKSSKKACFLPIPVAIIRRCVAKNALNLGNWVSCSLEVIAPFWASESVLASLCNHRACSESMRFCPGGSSFNGGPVVLCLAPSFPAAFPDTPRAIGHRSPQRNGLPFFDGNPFFAGQDFQLRLQHENVLQKVSRIIASGGSTRIVAEVNSPEYA